MHPPSLNFPLKHLFLLPASALLLHQLCVRLERLEPFASKKRVVEENEQVKKEKTLFLPVKWERSVIWCNLKHSEGSV